MTEGLQTAVPRPSQVLPKGVRTVAYDTETSGLHADDGARVATVSVAWVEPDGKTAAWAFPFDQGPGLGKDGQPVSLFSDLEQDEWNLDEQEWEFLLAWLKEQRLVFHNAKFDLAMMRAGTRLWPGAELEPAFWWCTMTAQREIDPGYDLNPKGTLKLKPVATKLGLARELGDEILSEDEYAKRLGVWLKRNQKAGQSKRYDLAPWDLIGPYAAQDALLTILLYRWQLEVLDEGIGNPRTVAHRFRVLRALYRMEKRGIGYDVAGSLEVAGQIRNEIEQREQELPFRNTLPAAKQFFFNERGVIPYKVTEKGAASLDVEVLTKMVTDQVPWAQEYAALAKCDTALSMWYQGYPDKIGTDGRLRTEFQQTKVKSGRMSSTRTNLQAIPKGDKTIEGYPDVRQFFRAREGYRLWNGDLKQAELVVASEYAGCKLMKQMLAEGADLHSITCAEVIGGNENDENWAYKRDIAKRLTFGGIFQIGARTFQATCSKYGIFLTLEECETIVARWRGMYPEYGKAYRRSEAIAKRLGYVVLMPGTEYATRSLFGPMDYHNTAWSRRVQGSLAEFLGVWLTETEDLFAASEDADVRDSLVLTVHDSLVLELPDDERGPAWTERVADLGAKRGTELFGCQMRVEHGPWHK